jgi:hypothetical protein
VAAAAVATLNLWPVAAAAVDNLDDFFDFDLAMLRNNEQQQHMCCCEMKLPAYHTSLTF